MNHEEKLIFTTAIKSIRRSGLLSAEQMGILDEKVLGKRVGLSTESVNQIIDYRVDEDRTEAKLVESVLNLENIGTLFGIQRGRLNLQAATEAQFNDIIKLFVIDSKPSWSEDLRAVENYLGSLAKDLNHIMSYTGVLEVAAAAADMIPKNILGTNPDQNTLVTMAINNAVEKVATAKYTTQYEKNAKGPTGTDPSADIKEGAKTMLSNLAAKGWFTRKECAAISNKTDIPIIKFTDRKDIKVGKLATANSSRFLEMHRRSCITESITGDMCKLSKHEYTIKERASYMADLFILEALTCVDSVMKPNAPDKGKNLHKIFVTNMSESESKLGKTLNTNAMIIDAMGGTLSGVIGQGA